MLGDGGFPDPTGSDAITGSGGRPTSTAAGRAGGIPTSPHPDLFAVHQTNPGRVHRAGSSAADLALPSAARAKATGAAARAMTT